jgi:hypothetical protein
VWYQGNVVVERDIDKPKATVTAACPECGDVQVIDEHRMISITHESTTNANVTD